VARILHCHPQLGKAPYHVFTDLDFWDARRILIDLATVKRNFAGGPPGDRYPTQILAHTAHRSTVEAIEYRISRAVPSPPRHVVVEEVLQHGYYVFDPAMYFPGHWTKSRVIHFCGFRLPVHQPPLDTPFREVDLSWDGQMIRLERVRRKHKHDPVISDPREARRRRFAPSCF